MNLSVRLGSTFGLTSLTTSVSVNSEGLRKGPKEMCSVR